MDPQSWIGYWRAAEALAVLNPDNAIDRLDLILMLGSERAPSREQVWHTAQDIVETNESTP